MKSRIYTLLIAALLVLTSCGSRTEEPKVETSDIRYGAEFFDLGIVCDGFAAGCGGDTDGPPAGWTRRLSPATSSMACPGTANQA